MEYLKNIIKSEEIRHFIAYFFVGGLATIVEWICFYLFKANIQYLLATALAIIISTFANWGFGRIFVFQGLEGKYHLLKEILSVYLASVVGLLLNLLIMWILHGQLAVNEMTAKIIATGLVFMYNYLVRTLLIYKKEK